MATKTCKHIYALHTSGEDGTKSKRAIFCCDLRHGFRVKQWRCVGLGHADCPLTAQQMLAPDKWESPDPTGIVLPLKWDTSQGESTPPTCG